MDIGLIIREKRMEKEISQIELADGICSQGTISNIENSSTTPSTVMLKQLAKKLNLDIFELLFKEDNTVELMLEKVNKLIVCGEPKKAYYQLVNSLKEDEILDMVLKKRYLYYLGNTCLIGLGDVVRAKEIFKRILLDFKIDNTVEDILIYVGLGIAECMGNNFKEGGKWIRLAEELLENKTLFVHGNINELMKIYFNIAKFYSEIKDFNMAVRMSDEGLFWATELNSSYHVDFLNYEKGFNLFHLGEIERAESCYNVAYVFAIFSKNRSLEKVIIEDVLEYGIDLSSVKNTLKHY